MLLLFIEDMEVFFMQSRMDKYQTEPTRKYERSKKNTKLYEDVYDDIYQFIKFWLYCRRIFNIYSNSL